MKAKLIPLPLTVLLAIVWLSTACQPLTAPGESSSVQLTLTAGAPTPALAIEQIETATPFPERPNYNPGELVPYTVQTGDTIAALAARFNTTVNEIMEANDFIPPDATTLPPGMPMQIPIYFQPFWGLPYQVIPDSLFINGPAQVGFDTSEFVNSQPGWLKNFKAYVAGDTRSGAEMVDYVAEHFSVSPRVLLIILEYQLGALSQPTPPANLDTYPLGEENPLRKGLYPQLNWAANLLNQGYYGWRGGTLTLFNHSDETIERPDPWQNAASVAIQYYYLQKSSKPVYQKAIGPNGFASTYQAYFGDPWFDEQPHIPGSLYQPEMLLPFESGKTWAYTGGPHTGWGSGAPFAAIDFAPPSTAGGCTRSDEWNVAVAAGTIVRSETGIVELDLDGDNDPRTGWTIFYLHLATADRPAVGTVLEAGDRIGHPSCEGGTSTGTHIHIARKYNGEWILADSVVPFNLEGWVAHNGAEPYQGTLTQFSRTVRACECSDAASQLTAPER